MMADGRDRDGGRVEIQIGAQQVVYRGEDRDGATGCGLSGACGIRLDGCNQSNALSGGFQFAVDAKVVASKGAGSGNGDPKNGLAAYLSASFCDSSPSTALRQRP